MKSWGRLLLFFLLLVVLAACNQEQSASSSSADRKNTAAEPVLWLVKTTSSDGMIGDLYVKYGKAEVEKMASDVSVGSQIANYDGTKVLFLDN
ncbi:hypothetical protein [Niallia sp. Krafla_26]|uniref:hypothetical protein n=1 Tax=Niallia sp. Krafla_26 TaxID=3064703 RepID=UPI003D1677A3